MTIFGKSNINHFVSAAKKDTPEWYISTFNTIEALATSNSNGELLKINNMIHGNIDKKDYNQYMNPFNFKEDRNKNIPGQLRNYDIMLSNVRRFLGEYVTSYQEFHVISQLPDEDNEMLDAANELAYKLLSKKAMQLMQKQEGINDPNDATVDVQSEVDNFKSRWKDNRVINDHNMLEYLRSNSDDAYLYAKAYFHWICYGRYFVHRRIESDDVYKEVLDPITTYVVGSADFVEDCDAVLFRKTMSLADIMGHYRNDFDEKEKHYIRTIQNHSADASYGDNDNILLNGLYKTLLDTDGINATSANKIALDINSVTVSTIYYKGFTEIKVLKYRDVLGNEFLMDVESDYELNPLIGDVECTIEWCPTVYEQIRVGSDHKGIYTKPKAIAVQRQLINNNGIVKLPVTGKIGIFPGFPNHSIPKLLYPFQVTINLLHLVRERSIITAKGKIGIIPKELLGSSDIDQENEMYNMLVTKTLFATTESIPNIATVIQSLKSIDLSDYEFIKMIDSLIATTTEMADNVIDMNRNRRGAIYAGDSKGANQDALTQVSMGSAIINIVFDMARCKDYQADIDFSKVAWINGKKSKFVTTDRHQAFFEINGTTHAETEYGVFVNNSFEYDQQREQIKEYVFNLGQNGQVGEDVILDIITNKNISKLKEIVQIAKALRTKREDDQFNKTQETQQAISQQTAQTETQKMEFDRWKVETECLNELLIKEVDLTIKQLDMNQEDKNNAVLAELENRKQALQTQINIMRRQS